MIALNLLSPAQKQELKNKRLYLLIKELIMSIFVFTSVIAIILLAARYILESQLAYLLEKNATTIAVSQTINRETTELNKQIERAANIQKDFKKWSALLIYLQQITPPDITYSLIKIYRQESSLELQGLAKNRATLINLQKNLTGAPVFKQVNLPLDDLLAKEDNNFHFQISLNQYELP